MAERPRFGAWSLAALLAGLAGGETPEDYLRHRWVQVEIALFRQTPASDPGIAPRRLVATLRLPRLATPLLDAEPPRAGMLSIGARPPFDDALPVLISNLPPPVWYAGECAAATWTPTPEAPRDPCLPERHVDLEALFSDDPWAAAADLPPAPAEPPAREDPRLLARQALADAFAEYERELLDASHVWRAEAPTMAAALGRLRERHEVLIAGGWRQPLPARENAQPLLVQLGDPDEGRRYPLEGWWSVAAGRFLHLKAELLVRLGGEGDAVFRESRRMRRGELHYLDHPAIGMLAVVRSLAVPDALLRQLEAVEAADG